MATYTITENFEEYCQPIIISREQLTPVYEYNDGNITSVDENISFEISTPPPNSGYATTSLYSGMCWCGTNRSSIPYCTLDTSKKKIDTIFIASYHGAWSYSDGLKSLKIYNDTGDIYDFKNIYTYVNSLSLSPMMNNTETQVTVLALYISGMKKWNSIKIESYGSDYNHLWVAYHTKSNQKIDLPWINNYMIKNNSQLYIINEENYDTSTEQYKSISSIPSNFSKLYCDDLLDTPDYLNGLRPIDLFEGDIQLILPEYDSSSVPSIDGIKSTRELVVASGDINDSIAQTINSITLNYTKSDNSTLKLALSIDKGETWKTYDGANWQDLGITIPQTSYSSMSSTELSQWNNARDVIYDSGIDPDVFNTLDFNTLTDTEVAPDVIRFAYVLDRPSYSDEVSNDELNWDFDAKGSLKKMKDSEYDIDVYEHQILFTSLIESSMIIVNIII